MKVMFVCTGNICRSAMSEGMFKKMVKERNLDIDVCSAGVHAETGDYATYNAIAVSNYYDVDISKHRATNIRDSRIKDMDLILCATQVHRNTLISLYPDLIDKIYTMKEFAGLDKDGNDLDIKDAWSYSMDVYRNCIIEIEKCLNCTIEKIQNVNNKNGHKD